MVYISYMAYVVLYCIALGLLLSVPKLRGKGWLIACLVIQIILTFYQFLNYLVQTVFKFELDYAWYDVPRLFYVLTDAALVGFILAWKPAAEDRLLRMLFTFKGRVGRQFFWIVSLTLLAVNAVAGILLSGLSGPASSLPAKEYGVAAKAIIVGVSVLWLGVSAWISLATQVKRWHDLDKSGWWVLIGLIPIIGGLGALIETGFFKGTADDNQYGEPPSQVLPSGEETRVDVG